MPVDEKLARGPGRMWMTSLFSLLLVIAAVVLILTHLSGWKVDRERELDEREHDYLRRRFRRRIQVSGMVGVVGIAIFAGQWITQPLVGAIYWLAVMGIVAWIILLAIADMVATQMHFANVRSRHAYDEKTLRAELKNAQAREQAARSRDSANDARKNGS